MVWVIASLYTFIALISLFGYFGARALTERVKLVAAFNDMQIGSFIASLVLGVIALIQLYSKKYDKQASSDCKDPSMSTSAQRMWQAAITAIYAVIWLIQFCTFDERDSYYSESDKYPPTDGLFIVHSYIQELRVRRYPTIKYTVVEITSVEGEAQMTWIRNSSTRRDFAENATHHSAETIKGTVIYQNIPNDGRILGIISRFNSPA
ncbi:hypothetical protein ARMGADRAFT_1068278 [Armillaria gallica]|uniref:Uncharacterized protein n=1 Tax=Armillaria gallica TaxID=47427 RepID=A0A2H3D3Y8_ARMGA|nr:hypothetical protein ARMGADRAFT_1068278 [Armillaria gallica]